MADSPVSAAPARPLVIRCGALGDVVMLTTMIRLLHARYGARVDVVGSGPWTRPLLQHEPALGHLQLLTSRNTPYWLCPSQWALVRWLRRRPRGPIYMCDRRSPLEPVLARAGIREEDIVRLPHSASPSDEQEVWPDRWIRMGLRDPQQRYSTQLVADPGAFRLPRVRVTEPDRRELREWLHARDLLGPHVLFQPGNKRTHRRGQLGTLSHHKYWPPASWAEVANAIWQHQPDHRIVLCGSPGERRVLQKIHAATRWDPRMYNAAGELPVPRLLALLESAHSLVSVDTGPAHAAAALACPLVVMFGAASPLKWRPIGPGEVRVLGGEREEASRVRDIPAADVIAAWSALAPRAQASVLSMP